LEQIQSGRKEGDTRIAGLSVELAICKRSFIAYKSEHPKTSDNRRDLGVEGRIMLKSTLKKQVVTV
jgi:hypothetical protein